MSQEWTKDSVKLLSDHFKCREGENDKVLRTIAVKNDVLYIWNEVEKCVECLDTKGSEWCRLIPRPDLYFRVENVSVNSTSTILCLSGSHGVATVELPDRQVSGDRSVDVNATSLCQRLFVCGHGILRNVEWYPASPTDSHLLLLTSDEKLRLCDVLEGRSVWDVCLGNHDSTRRNLPSKSSLGETPVDFDIGPACETFTGITWPVYVVWGNGDVYVIHTNLEEPHRKVNGPLKMVPSVQDNYGCDASSILVLQTNPPLIVTATCNGLLNHFLLLEDEDEGILHSVERIQLELGLTLCEEREDDVVSCPVTLRPHPDHVDRYFCVHDAGIHSLLLPLVQRLAAFSDGETDLQLLDVQSSVDYLLCTALNSDGNVSYSPILGFSCLDMTKLLVLLSNGKLTTVLLPNRLDDLSFVSNDTDKVTENEVRNGFTVTISNMLKENGMSSLPVIKLPGDRSKPSDWFDIVSKTTQSLRLVLKCHTEVALKIRQKSEVLASILSHQADQVRLLDSERAELRCSAEQIAERYEEINDRQNELMERTESLLIKIDCDRDKVLDSNHKKMMALLEKAKSKLVVLERDKNAVQSFYSNLETVNKNQPLYDQDLDDSKVTMLLKHVKLLTSELSELTKKVKTAQQTASRLHFYDS